MRILPRILVLASLPALLALVAAGCSVGGGQTKREQRAEAAEEQAKAEARPATVEFATFPSITRLQPHVDVEGAEAGDSIALEAARGEREGGQLVAWATKGTPRVVLEPSDLRADDGARIPAERVRAYIEHALRVERGSPAGRSGTYTDPLIPAKRRDVVLAGPDQRLLAWIDVDVPGDARPGTYVGAVRVRRAVKSGATTGGEDGVLARVPVRLTVRDATIPKVPTLASHVGFDQSQLVRFEGVAKGSQELREVTDRYAAELAHARLSIADVGVLPPGAFPGERSQPGDAEYLRRIFDRRGVASVRIPFYMDYPFADPLGRDRPAAVAYLRAASRWARANGWGDRAYVFAIDEPARSRSGEVRELHELVREADPALELLVTTEPSNRAFRGNVDVFAPNISPGHFRPADVASERRAGRDTWWYPSITTWQPYPTLFTDELRPAPRALGWLAWQHGVRGFLYWTATHWHEVQDPYREPATYRETDAVGNGDGVLLYPGKPVGLPGTPVPSVRLLQLRDGIEDHDLLTLAACGATPAQRTALRRAARAVAPSMTEVDPSAAQVKALRDAAFELIEAQAAGSGCRSR